jgi:hypothetical protein
LQQMTLDDDDDELWLASPWMETHTTRRMIHQHWQGLFEWTDEIVIPAPAAEKK